MMDWDLGHWIMIIGWGIVILVIIAIIFIFYRSTLNVRKRNQNNIQDLSKNKDKLEEDNKIEENLQKAIFCYACGYKLEGKQLKYCPRCGTKI